MAVAVYQYAGAIAPERVVESDLDPGPGFDRPLPAGIDIVGRMGGVGVLATSTSST